MTLDFQLFADGVCEAMTGEPMSGTEPPYSRTTANRERLDQDDHDLLTFREVGERLRLEIAAAALKVAQLANTGSPKELVRAEVRLRDLRAAARRNAAQPINDANFQDFFGHPGEAHRNLPSPDSTE
ncbi:acyl-CoA synthetase [Mycobacterium sp. 236(2023)]|uniref:acyl-CoA synthetase n=1 Tax=Mycobacterium sp. 236(2023) TaxID=3038163 RepID=UPI002414E31D|nr:acyl-CoA synthetase [Mycobacterium sp. 236(2023)]MDG4669107.1 acyl-CoA synthetase [Mycobacterium sp. 236(2023)]